MAKLVNGILGGIRGKVGPVVGAKWKNIEYVRAAATPSNKPPTEKQLAQQARFKFMHSFIRPFQQYYTAGFRNEATRMTEANIAFSLNYKSALRGSYPDFEINFSKLVMSKGHLPDLFQPALKFISAATLELTWENIAEPITAYDDQVTLVLYDPELQTTDGFVGGVNRSVERCTFDINPRLVGQSLEAYAFVSSNNGKRVSGTQYLGRLSR